MTDSTLERYDNDGLDLELLLAQEELKSKQAHLAALKLERDRRFPKLATEATPSEN